MVFAQNMLYREQCTGLASLWMPFFVCILHIMEKDICMWAVH